VLPSRRGALGRMFPVLGRLSPGPPPRPMTAETRPRTAAAAAELGALLAVVARHQPVVIWLDDVQAADPDSLAVLRALLGARRPAPVTWLLADSADSVDPLGPPLKLVPPVLTLDLRATEARTRRRRRAPARSGRPEAAALDKRREEILVNRRRQLS
jgi:hypothetical protein